MPLPQHAAKMIAEAISQTANLLNCSIPEGGVIRMVEAVEQQLEDAGYVVVTRCEFEGGDCDGCDDV